MKIDYPDLKRAMDYIDKHSDKGAITIIPVVYGTVKDALQITFSTLDGDKVTLGVSEDDRGFDTITRTERF